MKQIVRILWISAVITVSCQLALFAAGTLAPGRAPKNVDAKIAPAKPEPPVVTQVMQKKLAAPVTRAAMVNTLLSNPETRTIIKKEAEKAGVGESQFSGIAYKAVFKDKSVVGKAADQLSYALLDWDKGLTFTLTKVPTFASGKYHAGDLVVKYAQFSSESDVASYLFSPYDHNVYRFCTLYLDLPLQPATYMVTVRLMDKNGQSPKEWVRVENDDAYLKCLCYRTAAMSSGDMWVYDQHMQLIPMKDCAGYAGIFSISPLGHTVYISPTMRNQNYQINLDLSYLNGAIPKELTTMVLKDVTVTRL